MRSHTCCAESAHKCPYLPSKDKEALVNDFRDHAIAKVRDIEELGALGKKMEICPYYASRSATKPSEVRAVVVFSFDWPFLGAHLIKTKIITLPYQLLLQKSAREALGLSLKGHVVIVDEAHNLMDVISNIYSVSISLQQILKSRSQLGVYLQRFRNRLKGKNRLYLAQTVRLLDSLIGYLQDQQQRRKQPTEHQVNVGDLMAGKGVDQINLYKLMRYLQESKLARKVEGYVGHQEQQQQQQQIVASKNRKETGNASGKKEASVPTLTHIQNFLDVLTNPSAEGRIFLSLAEGDIRLKYMLLDPTNHFREIVEDARAVILAGGTMSPVCLILSWMVDGYAGIQSN